MLKSSKKGRRRQTIIGLVGRIASGKSTLRLHLEDKLHAHTVAISDVIYEIAEERGISTADIENIQELSKALRKRGCDEASLAKETFMRIEQDIGFPADCTVVVEGLRMLHDIAEMKTFADTHFMRMILIFVEAQRKDRHVRFNKQSVLYNPHAEEITIFEFNRIDTKESESEIENLKDMCDIIFHNKKLSEEQFLNGAANIINYQIRALKL